MIFLPDRKIIRLLAALLFLLLVLPLAHFYFLRATYPLEVIYHTPRGEAVKVMAGKQDNKDSSTLASRLFAYLHDFYQNGL